MPPRRSVSPRPVRMVTLHMMVHPVTNHPDGRLRVHCQRKGTEKHTGHQNKQKFFHNLIPVVRVYLTCYHAGSLPDHSGYLYVFSFGGASGKVASETELFIALFLDSLRGKRWNHDSKQTGPGHRQRRNGN